ncbi:MAG TPA: PadR family transcriptional regulator [Pseudogracilibacillus sp.]|nr:PadR family transcriptional regulator [Pseudogracilibacillus sp.]
MNLRSQLLKGILEGCILAIIKQGPTYGYELSIKLNEFGLTDISEGSIYPILLRLQKDDLIKGKMKASSAGPKRKYYYLTSAGDAALTKFIEHWEHLKQPVDLILKGGKKK